MLVDPLQDGSSEIQETDFNRINSDNQKILGLPWQ